MRSAPALVALLMQRFYPEEFGLSSIVTCVWLKKDLHTPLLKETVADAERYLDNCIRLAEEVEG